MKKLLYLLVLCLLVFSSFTPQKSASCRRSGITGHVYLVTGNQMPSPDRPPAPPKGVKTVLYIYELTNISDVARDGTSAFYRSISTKPIKEVETAEDGSFKVKLKPGKYSLFVKKGELFYSSIFDEKNNIHPVEVTRGKMVKEDFRVNYDAVY